MIDHESIGRVMFNKGTDAGCIGVNPNPYTPSRKEWVRRRDNAGLRSLITEKIEMLFEPRFITPPETAELIESLVTASDSRQILEVGMYSGFSTLHVLRAIVGKRDARITSIDFRPGHDREFFSRSEFAGYFNFINGKTPECLEQFNGQFFDMVFVDSDHSLEHNESERKALMKITKPGSIWLFHDLPEWSSPENRSISEVRKWTNGLVKSGFMEGLAFPTCEQLDCLEMFGPNYPKQLNPHLGIFRRL